MPFSDESLRTFQEASPATLPVHAAQATLKDASLINSLAAVFMKYSFYPLWLLLLNGNKYIKNIIVLRSRRDRPARGHAAQQKWYHHLILSESAGIEPERDIPPFGTYFSSLSP